MASFRQARELSRQKQQEEKERIAPPVTFRIATDSENDEAVPRGATAKRQLDGDSHTSTHCSSY